MVQKGNMQKPIEGAWERYRRELIRDAVAVPLKEARAAYYSGASDLFELLMCGLAPGGEATQQDVAMLDSIKGELEQFEKSVERDEEE